MKMHRIVTYFIDHEGYGIEDYKTFLKQMRYGNPIIGETDTTEIGKWSDDHILNKLDTPNEVFEEFFKKNLDEEFFKKNLDENFD